MLKMISIPLKHFFHDNHLVKGEVGKFAIRYVPAPSVASIRTPHPSYVHINGDATAQELREIADILDQLTPPVEKIWETVEPTPMSKP